MILGDWKMLENGAKEKSRYCYHHTFGLKITETCFLRNSTVGSKMKIKQ